MESKTGVGDKIHVKVVGSNGDLKYESGNTIQEKTNLLMNLLDDIKKKLEDNKDA